ncbi:dioxygenase family protein [Ehrlichia chaffeensis str. Heartland]|uniref:Dioxygenase family protein n=1 Tax=Ehrlichia chaffeensis (strain ATCC CRL-10679 / Arkansas) TaxID=205920 RepID=Q2GH95_EHRCR|nr:protocatechuate 3,4-dioxygenase [Ehrlichia chaffeensis]ABD44803.1 dioxygenase family protein [Ehrlichia chaffeensis str. Arkansas]AHX03477.1 dioxygenase family protein [Ehrlichia chaffeensis str. Heartland]AHX05803.1 dioxygenase family protein [Ehrlichia chaffeensis str. Jax]AHX06795.1 dioxygenase family protein [Ehrlichia chaffeensis str. Liberty]AHX07338.1 dioxygenase family protein [Ehrlichia chaffeensis str. Osceola]
MNYLAKSLLCLLISITCTYDALAIDPILVHCQKTPEIFDLNNKPSKFSLSNNLRRKMSSPLAADGELIYIVGKVTNTNCIPIANANVFIWHTNAHGIYQDSQDDKHKSELILEELDMYDYQFIGSGKSVTDNLGNYSFITIIPGINKKNKVPRIHFLLQHSEFSEFNTTMFFPEYDNSIDNQFQNIDFNLQDLLVARYTKNTLGIKTYYFNITIEDKNPYKSYK